MTFICASDGRICMASLFAAAALRSSLEKHLGVNGTPAPSSSM